jgi:methylated-DNA-protein-cysteine methyltransferase-like protein
MARPRWRRIPAVVAPAADTDAATNTDADADADADSDAGSGRLVERMSQRRGTDRVHGDLEVEPISARDQVFAVVRAIPEGRVMTYGQISGLLGSRLSPRAVGWMLHRCPEDVPWQRVVNASGGCSTDRLPDIPDGLQRAILEGEGVRFEANGRIDLDRYRWQPPPMAGARG